ncbi:MAG: hypothetical protein IKC03_09070 [Oscillospiraceae bacterium]|nr:hypothetical protein [Oscillospiraceae bacterium]
MSGNEKKEFGDYQTPSDFCERVCDYLISSGIVETPRAILEPTCGIGNFLQTANRKFSCDLLFGVEINKQYANEARHSVPTATVINTNIFDFDARTTCKEDDVLIIGNPPWATNSNLNYNLPKKKNFKGLRGIDALTGSSNFDICEYVILQLLDQYRETNSTICMLCKTSVARNIILEIARNKIPCQKIQMLNYNSTKVFGISAASCVFVIKLSSNPVCDNQVQCEIKNFDTLEKIDTLLVSNGVLCSSTVGPDLEGKCQMIWRQGVKHDCGKVMELDKKGDTLVNKFNSVVPIETDLIFPLVKSSHFKKPVITEFSKCVIVTQRKSKQDTSYIQQQFPLTWEYLQSHIAQFNSRKSVIYSNAPTFSMFGVGDYSYAPYKVGLSGFYKKPLFALLYSDKPVMTDDTAYFLPFDDYDTAYCMMLLLNSRTVQQFLLSIAFLDNKRPYTVKLLSRLDLKKCVDSVSFDEIKQTEKNLLLNTYVSTEQYHQLKQLIYSLG